MTIIKYKLRYDGKGNLSYNEISTRDRRDVRKEPSDEFGKTLEEMIKN